MSDDAAALAVMAREARAVADAQGEPDDDISRLVHARAAYLEGAVAFVDRPDRDRGSRLRVAMRVYANLIADAARAGHDVACLAGDFPSEED